MPMQMKSTMIYPKLIHCFRKRFARKNMATVSSVIKLFRSTLTSHATIFQLNLSMWRHREVQADWRSWNLQSGSERHRHVVRFFNVPVQASTLGQLILVWNPQGPNMRRHFIIYIAFRFPDIKKCNTHFLISQNRISDIKKSFSRKLISWYQEIFFLIQKYISCYNEFWYLYKIAKRRRWIYFLISRNRIAILYQKY